VWPQEFHGSARLEYKEYCGQDAQKAGQQGRSE
jgi:hypothetical protein